MRRDAESAERRSTGLVEGPTRDDAAPSHPAPHRDPGKWDNAERRSSRIWLADLRVLFAVALVVGSADALFVLGWPVINPVNIDWLKGDPATHYLGWAFYRQDPAWHFPIAWTSRLGYPVGTSVAYQDAIPLLAVPFRMLDRVLPDPFQYLGLYAALSLILHMYFGLLLCRRLCGAHPLFTYAGGFLILLSPVLVSRLHGHFALASHWLLLAGLLAYFRVTPGRPRSLLPFLVLCAVAGGINPYLSLMCMLIALAAGSRMIAFEPRRWPRAVATCALAAVVLMGSLAIFGFLGGVERSAQAAGGYGAYSLNLLGPLNSTGLANLLPPLRSSEARQVFEGYSYLGAGVLLLLALHLAFRFRRIVASFSRIDIPTLGLVVLCVALALSTTVTFGPYVLFRLPVPTSLELWAAAFRSSGRLFWPAYYVIVLASVVWLFRFWRSPLREFLLVLAVVLQVADLPPVYAHTRANHDRRVGSPLRSPLWNELGRDHARLLVIPPWICPDTPGGEDSYRFFGLLAARLHMETNTYYPARPSAQALREHCGTILRRVMAGKLERQTAYVVNDSVLASLRARHLASHDCQTVDGFHLCTRRAPTDESPPVSWVSSYRLGEPIDFTAAGQAAPYLQYGWSRAEPDGTWTEGTEAALAVRLDPPPTGPLEIVAVVTPFLAKGHRRLRVDVVANGHVVAAWHFSGRAQTTAERARIDAAAVTRETPLVIDFRIRDARSPASLGLSDDHRALGLFVRTVSIGSARVP